MQSEEDMASTAYVVSSINSSILELVSESSDYLSNDERKKLWQLIYGGE